MSVMQFAVPAGTRVSDLNAQERKRLLERGRALDARVTAEVATLINEVRVKGDDALREQAKRFDNVKDLAIEVPRASWRKALDQTELSLRDALALACDNIATFHKAQLPQPLEIEPIPGMKLGRRADPLERVAVYAPGGRAVYPSSVLMGVVPARVAGVGDIVVCSPAGPNGLPPAAILAACEMANADRLLAIGGAGAIAAVAYGTSTVPRVDKVVGPGNAYVTEAKRQLNGIVATDAPAGPSEVLVLADENADPMLVTYELLAQAEHDPDAAAVLVTTDITLLTTVAAIIGAELEQQPRGYIISDALKNGGALLLAESLEEMLAFSQEYAPEHLALYIDQPRALLSFVRNAGTVFLGSSSSVAFGDYITGANHVLPTATLARAYSGLSTSDFLRWTTYQELNATVAAQLAPATATLAAAEGLPAHAYAARLRAGEQ